MQHDLVISGGTIATASETFSADIGIRDGQIGTLGEELKGRDEINASGKLVLPGGIETHLE